MVGAIQAQPSSGQDSQRDKGGVSATDFRPLAVRAGVMGPTEIAGATNFRPPAVRAGVMGPTEIASATNFRPLAVRAGVMGPTEIAVRLTFVLPQCAPE